MSATIGNMQEIGDFLNAYVYTRDFRPVQLTETIKIDDAIFVINKDIDGTLSSKLDRKLNFSVCFKYLPTKIIQHTFVSSSCFCTSVPLNKKLVSYPYFLQLLSIKFGLH